MRTTSISTGFALSFYSIIAGFVMKGGERLVTFGNMAGAEQPEMRPSHDGP